MKEHLLPESFLHDPIRLLVVGAGGNGSQFVNGLARLHVALRAVGHPYGLHVTVTDPDRVTEANVGRQLFSPSDIGHHKAAILVHRLNTFYNLDWQSRTTLFTSDVTLNRNPQIIVGCVDSAAARREIHRYFGKTPGIYTDYWLDLGNQARSGQVVLGQGRHSTGNRNQDASEMLPCVTDLFPELLDLDRAEDDAPSCSLAEALGKQDLFINQAVTTWALHLLWTFFRHGRLNCHGYYVNLETGTSRPMPIDPEGWLRMAAGQPESVTRRRNKKGRTKVRAK